MDAIINLNAYFEKHNLTKFSKSIAVNRTFSYLLPLIGLPTHHNKIVAFQTPASPIMEGIVDLHHDIMTFLAFIILFVLYLLVVIMFEFSNKGDLTNIHGYSGDNVIHSTPIELI
jgi:heme/copper-type cytochrome/quinol oxidase subunit 2